MCPVLHLRLFGAPIDLHAYSLFAALAAAAGAVSALVILRRERLGYLRSLLLLAAMATGFFLGARLWNWAVNPGNYAGGLTPFSFRLAGFSLYGGIVGAFAALFAMSFVFRRGLWPLLDTFVLPTAAAFALARVGCFLNGCCGGRLTQGWLGVRFPHESVEPVLTIQTLPFFGNVDVDLDLPQYPTQLMELVLALLGLAPALWLYFRGKVPAGVPFLVYGIWFTAMRWGVLYFRALTYPEYVVHIIYPLIYAVLIVCGIVLLIQKLCPFYTSTIYKASQVQKLNNNNQSQ